MHEPVVKHKKIEVGSARMFGYVIGGFFVIVALLPLIRGHEARWWALGVAAAFLLVALVYPRVLQPLNILWFRFGLLLHAIVGPIVMSVIFWITVAPVGVIMRAMGKDPLRLKLEADAASYWITRDPPGPEPGSMSRQF